MKLIGQIVEKKYFTAEKYLKLTKEQQKNIKSTDIVPPKLGTKNFGKIKIQLKNPEFKNNVY